MLSSCFLIRNSSRSRGPSNCCSFTLYSTALPLEAHGAPHLGHRRPGSLARTHRALGENRLDRFGVPLVALAALPDRRQEIRDRLGGLALAGDATARSRHTGLPYVGDRGRIEPALISVDVADVGMAGVTHPDLLRIGYGGRDLLPDHVRRVRDQDRVAQRLAHPFAVEPRKPRKLSH